ncbi:DNA repair protein RecO [Patescibacteria group bacterium]|nr:DNA repair protein RecO [Patescibacteria group bacterium]
MTSERVYKAEGIILKRKNISEADRILTIFTKEYGKIRAIAKGIRKVSSRRAPHLEVFTRVRLVLHRGKTFENISEVEPVAIYQPLREDLTRVSMAYYLCELVDSLLPEHQEHRDIFLLLSEALSSLSAEDGTRIYERGKAFTLETLWSLGFLPRTKTLNGEKLQAFIETITERRLKSTHFAKQLMNEKLA